MAKPAKSKSVLENENRLLRRYNGWVAFASIANELIKWTGLVLLGYFSYCTIDSLSGKETNADISILAKAHLNEVFAWIVGIGGVGYGWQQRRLCKTTEKRLQNRIRKLEKNLDPNRSSTNDVDKEDVE